MTTLTRVDYFLDLYIPTVRMYKLIEGRIL